MDKSRIYEKFAGNYIADDYTFIMGIDIRFSDHLAQRFADRQVLETCSGAGFSTISLAKYARHVFSVDIDAVRLNMAKKNVGLAGLADKVTFIHGNIIAKKVLSLIPDIEAAFIDPDWAVSGENHVYKFLDSNTLPPSDKLLALIFNRTSNITLIQPPYINREEFRNLPLHECEYLFMNNRLELFCFHFGDLARQIGSSEFRI